MPTQLIILAASFLLSSPQETLINATDYRDSAAIAEHRDELVTIKISGKVSHAGPPDYHAIVAGVHIWMPEYPDSKKLNILSDDKGWWAVNLLKRKGVDAKASIIYAKSGWITTKSNVMTFGDRDDVDLGMQYINPVAFRFLIKPVMEVMLANRLAQGSDSTLKNAMVVTVGKSFASMHDDRLPHGDPGATMNAVDGAVGPIYFDERVKPNISYKATSVDGGVTWLNVPKGRHLLKAAKPGVTYRDVEFSITDDDEKEGVILYIASPPDSVQGSNNSPPGKN